MALWLGAHGGRRPQRSRTVHTHAQPSLLHECLLPSADLTLERGGGWKASSIRALTSLRGGYGLAPEI